ncbi:MAG: hypothetical protein DRP18_04635, partial [Candidatus Aenigmatarchaeota archaeon]
AVIAVVLGLLLANYVGLFGEDYGTGLSLNTTTKKAEYYGYYAGKDKKYLYGDGGELLNEVYISSWQPQGKSTEISFYGEFYFNQYYYYAVIADSPKFFLGQYAWVVSYIDSNRQTHTIINGINNWYDRDIVVDLSGQIGGNLPNMPYKKVSDWTVVGQYAQPNNIWGDNTWTCFVEDYAHGISNWHLLQTAPLSFKIKGNKIGGLIVDLYIEVTELDCPISGCRWLSRSVGYVVHDEAYLASGIGRVDVLGANSIRQDGTTYTEGTNREVPLYVFEEGSTIYLSVDTGYAGAVSGQKGWRLAIYKADQTQPLKIWWLDDDLRGYEIEWTIPQGTFTPGGNNRMKVVLTNTIIDQAETTFFVVDKLNKIPGTPQVILDRSQYNEGDTVHVTLRAEANPNGTGEITKFYVEVKWDSPDSTNYVISPKYLTAHHVSGFTYETSFSFIVNRPNRYFYVLAWAMDRDGRSSGRGTNEAYVKQVYGNYKITFHVVDTNGDPIERAKIEIKGVTTKYTDANGNATFWLENKQYEYTVSKDGYKAFSSSFVANADKTIEVTLQPVWSWVLILIGAIVLIAIVSGVVYYYYKKKGGIK